MPDKTELEDLFRPFGAVTIKRMFGGHGIYADGLMFALEAQGEVYLKTDAENSGLFDAENLRPFEFESKRGLMITSYRLLPAQAYDDEGALIHWAKLGLAAAQRAADAKSGKAVKKAASKKVVAKKTPKISTTKKSIASNRATR